jgi:endonuclease/exonuclease/phosphatase family metal-dependent hydrolase
VPPRRPAPPAPIRALAPIAEALRKAPRPRFQGRSKPTPLQAAAAAIESKPGDQIRLFTLNVAHGRRQESHQALLSPDSLQQNLADVAATLRELAPDVVALQEADGPSAWSGNFDHVEMLAELAELAAHYRGNHNPFGRGRFNLASGTALLARLPLSEASSERFAKSWRDTKGFVAATISVPQWGDLGIDVVSVHLDFLTPNVRRRQIRVMIDKLKGRDRPLAVLGDLNCCWRRDPKSLDLLTGELGLRAHQPEAQRPTYPSHRPRHRLDWILISDQLEFGGYHTVAAPLSDHLGLVADIKLR